ncbi:MAG: VCBS repeat-containing protein, partial [Planctomycetes bacterium]|nr:VCBS repeat-containing protein [Planctomycetota bacterium]
GLGQPVGLFAGDRDGGGETDVLVAEQPAGNIFTVINGGNGATWASNIDIDTGISGVGAVYAADLRGSGNLDVAAVMGSGIGSRVAWYANDAGSFGTRQSAASFPSVQGPVALALADLDSDGDQDIAVVSQGSDALAWLESSGSATPSFSLHTVDATLSDPSALAAGNIDGRAGPDLVAVSPNAGGIRWYRNGFSVSF